MTDTTPLPIRFAIVGGGWRAEFFTRIAKAMPDRFKITGVMLRDPAKAAAFSAKWGAPAVESYEALAKTDPEFVVLSVDRMVRLEPLKALAELKLWVLCETPPAPDLASLMEVWSLVENKGLRLKVAEQYFQQPLHAARMKVIADGRLGKVTSARVSIAHAFHGVSLMRKFLGVLYEDTTIRARRFVSQALEGPTRDGWGEAERMVPTKQMLGEFDYGDKLGLFDFTDVQYRSPVHSHRAVIRGERGEIADLEMRTMERFGHPLVQKFRREGTGEDGNLDGFALERIYCGDQEVWQNPFPGVRLMDDEIAIALVLQQMGERMRGIGRGPYGFSEAAQDQYLNLMMAKAADTGETIRTTRQPWAH